MSRILIIPDLHFPYHKESAIPDIKRLIKDCRPEKIVLIGDVIDSHRISRHTPEADSFDAVTEFKKTQDLIKELDSAIRGKQSFLCIGNHEERIVKKAKECGIPSVFFKTFNELFKVSWNVNREHIIDNIYFAHGKTATIGKLATNIGMSAVQGHFHRFLCVNYVTNVLGKSFFDAYCGAMCDDDSLAMRYSKDAIHKSTYGTIAVVNGNPIVYKL